MGFTHCEQVVSQLAKLESTPAGRMESFSQVADKATCIVDYAHTPDALENAANRMSSTLPWSSCGWYLVAVVIEIKVSAH